MPLTPTGCRTNQAQTQVLGFIELFVVFGLRWASAVIELVCLRLDKRKKEEAQRAKGPSRPNRTS